MVSSIVKLIRPKHWVKNLFVFAPLIFARELFNPAYDAEAVRAFIAFCLASSTVYVFNDIFDAEADRVHPVKRNRPIASGRVSIAQAVAILVVLLVLTAVIAYGMDLRFIVTLVAYLVVNVAYSIRLKEVVLLDVFMVAAGFMLRVLGGAYAINVAISSWLVLCSLFISLFLGFAKRRGELEYSPPGTTADQRKVLSVYRLGFLDQMLTIAASGAVISYALYTMASRTIETFHTEKLIYTTVFVLFGVFRYLYLIHTSSSVENPTATVTSDIPIIITVALWILSCIGLIYTASGAGPMLP